MGRGTARCAPTTAQLATAPRCAPICVWVSWAISDQVPSRGLQTRPYWWGGARQHFVVGSPLANSCAIPVERVAGSGPPRGSVGDAREVWVCQQPVPFPPRLPQDRLRGQNL